MSDAVINNVIGIHAQEAAILSEVRAAQVLVPHVNLHSLGRLDDRLLAHFDGLAVAGESAWRLLDAEFEGSSRGSAFAVAVRAIESVRADVLESLWVLGKDASHVCAGVLAAFGWVEPRHLQGIVRDLLKSADSVKRSAGLSACAMHRADPGLGGGPWLDDAVPTVRARALRAVGELGLTDLASSCASAQSDGDADCQFWAVWSRVLLGGSASAMDALRLVALDAGAAHRARAFRLLLQATDPTSARATLQAVGREPSHERWLIQGSGLDGDPAYVPWLLKRMAQPRTARLAGEAFTLITGADLDAEQLWQAQPDDFESGPNDDPEDENVDMDPDEGLMWPDPAKVEQWWSTNGHRFVKGRRYFMGAPVTWEHCVEVLRHGYQRQRILAAHYLCLLRPGTPLFNTSAPAWRQQALLAKMS